METDTALHLSQDFCEACKMFGILPKEAIQFYIAKTTVYANLCNNRDFTLFLASGIFNQYQKCNNPVYDKIDPDKRQAGIKYVTAIAKLILEKSDVLQKEKAYNHLIENWYAVIESHLPEKIIYTTNGLRIDLTEDFRLLCDMFGYTPSNVLQHYVDQISLPDYISSSESEFTNATTFFLQYPPIIRQLEELENSN
jgi:hypothetical protein